MNKAQDALLGLATGDALGVPVEFYSRETLDQNPVTTMQGYGTYTQPAGTWSDDSSLAFCLAESLTQGYNPGDMARRFIAWRYEAYWSPHGHVFDIGSTTMASIEQLRKQLKHGDNESLTQEEAANGQNSKSNGGLMRILPLYFYLHGQPVADQFNTIREATALTHGNIRSVLACTLYLLMADEIVKGCSLKKAYKRMQEEVRNVFSRQGIAPAEQAAFERITESHIAYFPRHEIESTGYVVHALEAALWSLLTSNSYKETVLKAVNLGDDTDTTAAIAGGLAGLYYGKADIPVEWLEKLVRRREIEDLCDRLHAKYPIA